MLDIDITNIGARDEKTELFVGYLLTEVLDMRDRARIGGNFERADRIRNNFAKFGYQLCDEKIEKEKQ